MRRLLWEDAVEFSTDGCWRWRGAQGGGYGYFASWPGTRLAHRAFYEAFAGPVPDGLVIDHPCCVNPDHLETVTQAENIRRGRRASLTHAKVAAIRASADRRGVLAERYGVAPQTISLIRGNKRWAA